MLTTEPRANARQIVAIDQAGPDMIMGASLFTFSPTAAYQPHDGQWRLHRHGPSMPGRCWQRSGGPGHFVPGVPTMFQALLDHPRSR
jgi:hypothetical protein